MRVFFDRVLSILLILVMLFLGYIVLDGILSKRNQDNSTPTDTIHAEQMQ